MFLYPFSILLALTISGCGIVTHSSSSQGQSSKDDSSSNLNTSTSTKTSSSKTDGTSSSSSANSSSSNASSSSSSSSSSQGGGSSYVPDPTDTQIYFITEDTLSNGVYSATDNEYTFSVSGSYKQIYVNVPDIAVTVELNGVTLSNSENSPIYVEACDEISLSAKKNTTNVVRDNRATYTEDVDGQGKGAIYVEDGDLKLKGQGTLNVYGNYLNGIHGKDDVKIQKQTLTIEAVNHGIRGNDSVTVNSGTINISCGGDGLHSENSDISSKGNQRGNVTINGGDVTINSWGDAIQAAYNAVIDQTDDSVATSFVAKTNKYSSYSGKTVDTSTSSFYLRMSSSLYSNGNYTYAAYINNQWYKATYKGTQTSGGQGGFGGGGGRPSTYYYYQIEKPNGATSFTLYRFQGSNVTSFSTTTYDAVGDAKAFNSAYDTVQIQSVSNKKIGFGNWSNYSSGGNNNGADVSAKGIKAENEILIKAGTIDIKAYDDAIHANNDGSLDNGSTPLGNIAISGGVLTLNASDDGVHADGQLNISGGKTTVSSSYEGLEGNVINISGGESYVYGTDDGVNATSGRSSPAINVTGGFLDVEVPTNGDTDGIDSNGTYTQSGGTVIVKGPGSASGGGMAMAAALDTDGAVKITSGSLIVFGAIEQTPNSSVTKTLVSSTTVSSGKHTISFASSGTSYSTTLKSSSNGCVVYSSLGNATLS